MSKHFFILPIILAIATTAFAQKPRFGIKTGLNVASMMGGAETNSEGKTLDKNEGKTGFQVGITAALPLDNVFGVQAELLYTQRGSKYTYEDKGFYTFVNKFGQAIETQGDLRVLLLSSNSYLEVPLLVYVKPIKPLKIELGVSPMILLNSTGTGEFLLKNRSYTPTGSVARPLEGDMVQGLVYDYIKDGALQVPDKISDTKQDIGGSPYTYPSAIGAYYHNDEKPNGENMFNFFDLGANLGASYTFSSGLAFNLRGSYGLLDATNNRYDRKWSASSGAPNYKAVQLNRDLRNFNVALTIGFSF
jgi:hypothetical protein